MLGGAFQRCWETLSILLIVLLIFCHNRKTRDLGSVTLRSPIYENKETKVGDEVFLMGNSHVAHDSILGDRTILQMEYYWVDMSKLVTACILVEVPRFTVC